MRDITHDHSTGIRERVCTTGLEIMLINIYYLLITLPLSSRSGDISQSLMIPGGKRAGKCPVDTGTKDISDRVRKAGGFLNINDLIIE
jgi:hypothetical protein